MELCLSVNWPRIGKPQPRTSNQRDGRTRLRPRVDGGRSALPSEATRGLSGRHMSSGGRPTANVMVIVLNLKSPTDSLNTN